LIELELVSMTVSVGNFVKFVAKMAEPGIPSSTVAQGIQCATLLLEKGTQSLLMKKMMSTWVLLPWSK
jgi:hypothetical protein